MQHNLARLRTLIGLTQAEMAKLVGVSAATIQSIELGRLPLSEKLAKRISFESGVTCDWLIKNDLSESPVIDPSRTLVNIEPAPYSIRHFKMAQAAGGQDVTPDQICHEITEDATVIAQILAVAIKNDEYHFYKNEIKNALFSIVSKLPLNEFENISVEEITLNSRHLGRIDKIIKRNKNSSLCQSSKQRTESTATNAQALSTGDQRSTGNGRSGNSTPPRSKSRKKNAPR